MAAVVLPPRQFAVDKADVDGWHRRDVIVAGVAGIADAEETKHGAGGDDGHIAALVIEPVRVAFPGNAVADEDPARRDERDQFM